LSWFDLPHGITSDDMFQDVLNRFKPTEFAEAFTRWVSWLGDLEGGGDVVDLDGKVMR
jgi:hypothetical protein